MSKAIPPHGTRRCLAAWAWLAPMAAWAAPAPQPMSPQELMRLPPAVQRAYLQQRAAPGQQALVAKGVDTTAPVLSRFSVVDTAEAGGLASARFAVSDDLSGYTQLFVQAHAPHGGELRMNHSLGLPKTRLHDQVGLELGRYVRPGVYTFDFAYVSDAAGNYVVYDAAALAALGNTVLQVRNKNGHDARPPALIKGHILTPELSLSASHPGTSVPAYAGVQLQARDEGGSVTAGLWWAVVSFCLSDSSSCFYLYHDTNVHGQARANLHLGGQPVYATAVPGVYQMRDVQIHDHAGNVLQYTSTGFGGDTDLSQFFPSQVITLTP